MSTTPCAEAVVHVDQIIEKVNKVPHDQVARNSYGTSLKWYWSGAAPSLHCSQAYVQQSLLPRNPCQ